MCMIDAVKQINHRQMLHSFVLLRFVCSSALLRQQPLHCVQLVLEELREIDRLQAQAEPDGLHVTRGV